MKDWSGGGGGRGGREGGEVGRFQNWTSFGTHGRAEGGNGEVLFKFQSQIFEKFMHHMHFKQYLVR